MIQTEMDWESMSKNRIEWTGDTSTVAFVFEFIGDAEPEDIDFDEYQKYEKAHPGALVSLWVHHSENDEAWNSNVINLTEEQIGQLQIYIDCVNSWFIKNTVLFNAMNALYYTNMLIDNWDPADDSGLVQFNKDVEWWCNDKNWSILSSDIFERIEDALGDESFFFTRLSELNQDELMECFHDFWAGQFDLEIFLENSDDEISENEQIEIQRFLDSNILLVDFEYSSMRYHKYA